MSSLYSILITILLAFAIYGQDIGSAAHPYEAGEFKLENVAAPVGLTGVKTITTGNGAKLSDNWNAKFRIKNLSDKPMAKIHWQLKVVNGTNGKIQKEFKSKSKIKSGKDTVISEIFNCDPQLIPLQPAILIEVVRIEYEDGSFWEQPAQDPKK